MLDGGTALALFDDRITVTPPAGAAPLRVTVPVVGAPPTTVFGANVRLTITADFTVRVAVADFPPAEAVMVALVVDETDVVATVNEAEIVPVGTVTVEGGVAQF